MAAPDKKKLAAKAAAGSAKKKGRSLSSLYTIAGDKIQRKNKMCPKCGAGFFMANHKERMVCGHCKYTEFGKKS